MVSATSMPFTREKWRTDASPQFDSPVFVMSFIDFSHGPIAVSLFTGARSVPYVALMYRLDHPFGWKVTAVIAGASTVALGTETGVEPEEPVAAFIVDEFVSRQAHR